MIPRELEGLTVLEERLVAPRLPFMRIVSLGYERQSGIKGAVVNVPISLNQTVVQLLPRSFDNCEVVHLQDEVNFDVNDADAVEHERIVQMGNTRAQNAANNNVNDDEENINEGADEVLLENNPIDNICLAPGEGQSPISLLRDEDAEELSFPTIFCGQKRNSGQLTYSRIARSQIRRYDRRCARVDMLLWSYKYFELSKIQSSISICLRNE